MALVVQVFTAHVFYGVGVTSIVNPHHGDVIPLMQRGFNNTFLYLCWHPVAPHAPLEDGFFDLVHREPRRKGYRLHLLERLPVVGATAEQGQCEQAAQ